MKILIKDPKELIDSDLTPEQIGLCTIVLLLKENCSKMTLAKFKTKVKIKDYTKALIDLHEKGFIKWSGYELAKSRVGRKKIDPKIIDIVQFMNSVFGQRRKPDTKTFYSKLVTLLKSYTVEDIKTVIQHRHKVWANDKKMKQHLVAETVFGIRKFDKYLVLAQKDLGSFGSKTVVELSLKKGDIIDYNIAQNLLPNTTYLVKGYRLDEDGNTIGNGVEERKNGKVILRLVKAMAQSGRVNYQYQYIETI